ncbi:hypothetical protein D3C72_2343750 [compost metagenome]
MGEDQEPHMRALAERGCLHSIGWAKQPGWITRLETALEALITTPRLRTNLSTQGSTLIDGRGAERIATTLSQLAHDIGRR